MAPKHALKTPRRKSSISTCTFGGPHIVLSARWPGASCGKPQAVAGLLRPFIKMNYEPVGLTASIWLSLGGRGWACPLPALRGTLFLTPCLPPSLPAVQHCLPPHPPAPCLVLMKEKVPVPSRETPEQEAEFKLRTVVFLQVAGTWLIRLGLTPL